LVNPVSFFRRIIVLLSSFSYDTFCGKYTKEGGYMNSITDLLDLEDGDLCITETQIQGQTKTITIETKPVRLQDVFKSKREKIRRISHSALKPHNEYD